MSDAAAGGITRPPATPRLEVRPIKEDRFVSVHTFEGDGKHVAMGTILPGMDMYDSGVLEFDETVTVTEGRLVLIAEKPLPDGTFEINFGQTKILRAGKRYFLAAPTALTRYTCVYGTEKAADTPQ